MSNKAIEFSTINDSAVISVVNDNQEFDIEIKQKSRVRSTIVLSIISCVLIFFLAVFFSKTLKWTTLIKTNELTDFISTSNFFIKEIADVFSISVQTTSTILYWIFFILIGVGSWIGTSVCYKFSDRNYKNSNSIKVRTICLIYKVLFSVLFLGFAVVCFIGMINIPNI